MADFFYENERGALPSAVPGQASAKLDMERAAKQQRLDDGDRAA
jgi:hypothetical protein